MNTDRLGFYQVGNKKFYNKSLALVETTRTGNKLEWNFHNELYSKCNWSKPIDTSLNDLYKQRALQLRNKYDYLVLYFSGGSDSTNILLTFLENNIFLDEIVMQIPEPDRKNLNGYDISERNMYGEIDHVAVPFLQSLTNKINSNTKIRFQDFSKSLTDLLSRDDWFETNPLGTSMAVGLIGRQNSAMFEPHILNLCNSGKKCCQILGIDKPLVLYDQGKYFAYFTDSSAFHTAPISLNHKEIYHSLYVTEFFYWTPDMPEIVIKQAQEIKKQCEIDTFKKFLWSKSGKLHIEKFRSILNPIIYPDKNFFYFQTQKPKDADLITPYNLWFWETANQNVKNNFLDVINYLDSNINEEFFINSNINSGFVAITSKFYEV